MNTEGMSNSSVNQSIAAATTAVFSMKQAAEVAGISVSTLRRRRSDLVAAGADISPDGWKVPMTALVACGLIVGEGPESASRPASFTRRPAEFPEGIRQARQLEELTAQVQDLEREIAEWRRRAEVAEARAEERGRALDALRVANETERMALRMLTAGSTVPTPTHRSEAAPATQGVSPMPAPAPETAHPSPPMQQAPPPASEELRRKGFFSRVMGL